MQPAPAHKIVDVYSAVDVTVGIVQPCFLPWRGHFHLLRRCDRIVFYDDVQYDRGGWRNRNRIKTRDGLLWITVPVRHLGKPQLIRDMTIDNSIRWADRMLRTIRQEYSRAPYFDRYFEPLSEILMKGWERIADLDIHLTDQICRWLGFQVPFVRSSELPVSSADRVDRLVQICQVFGASRYLSGPTARAYLGDGQAFRGAGIALEFQKYDDYSEYPQLHGAFEPSVSIVDLLFNCGPDSSAKIWPC